jgi:hypothetical protein
LTEFEKIEGMHILRNGAQALRKSIDPRYKK